MPLNNRFIKVEKIDGKLKVIVIFYIWCAFVSDGLGCYNDVLAAWLRQPWAGAGLDRDRMTGTWARRRIALSIKVKRGKAVAKGQGGEDSGSIKALVNKKIVNQPATTCMLRYDGPVNRKSQLDLVTSEA